MRNWIRRWLGISELMQLTEKAYKAAESASYDVGVLRAEITAIWTDELNPARKAASDALGQKVIARLKAEDMARRHTLGEL